jgi:hypothetical protein
MVLRSLPPVISPSPCPGVPLPGHYKKGEEHPSVITTLTPPSFALSRVRNVHPTERLLRRLFPTVARPCPTLHRPLLQPMRLTAVPSPFFLNRGEVPCTGAPFRPFSDESPPRRCSLSTVDRRRPRSTNSWTWSTGFPLGKQFLEISISGILHLGPLVSSKLTCSP